MGLLLSVVLFLVAILFVIIATNMALQSKPDNKQQTDTYVSVFLFIYEKDLWILHRS